MEYHPRWAWLLCKHSCQVQMHATMMMGMLFSLHCTAPLLAWSRASSTSLCKEGCCAVHQARLCIHTVGGISFVQFLWASKWALDCTLLAHAQPRGYQEHDCHTPSPGCRPGLCARCGSLAGTPARGRGPPGPPSARGGPAAAARPPSCASAAHTLCIRRTACGHLCSCTTSQQTA